MSSRRLNGIRLLVVDDDDDSRELLTLSLEAEGASVSAVGSGSAALAFLREAPVDVLLGDIALPDIDGRELAASVRRSPEATRCIAVTGFELGTPDPFDAHVRKPIDLERLTQLILALTAEAAGS